eukprot:NODE_1039_length_1032_cov_172.256358_g863_i0.p1 GENE.NODE_1039_length_1032_cov_172.256358_g863_i0~~NODE_1039_length_1032_cov_172.256358_g863_i0.p1  ORF type:complete len:302 (+),score=19.17 NODE_1039_length_1032_cov_172.256358_g863_i0:24-908(+)
MGWTVRGAEGFLMSLRRRLCSRASFAWIPLLRLHSTTVDASTVIRSDHYRKAKEKLSELIKNNAPRPQLNRAMEELRAAIRNAIAQTQASLASEKSAAASSSEKDSKAGESATWIAWDGSTVSTPPDVRHVVNGLQFYEAVAQDKLVVVQWYRSRTTVMHPASYWPSLVPIYSTVRKLATDPSYKPFVDPVMADWWYGANWLDGPISPNPNGPFASADYPVIHIWRKGKLLLELRGATEKDLMDAVHRLTDNPRYCKPTCPGPLTTQQRTRRIIFLELLLLVIVLLAAGGSSGL